MDDFNSYDAAGTQGGLIRGANGVVYGVALGGTYGAGIVFSFVP